MLGAAAPATPAWSPSRRAGRTPTRRRRPPPTAPPATDPSRDPSTAPPTDPPSDRRRRRRAGADRPAGGDRRRRSTSATPSSRATTTSSSRAALERHPAVVVRAVPGALRRAVRAAQRRRVRRLPRAHRRRSPGAARAEPTTVRGDRASTRRSTAPQGDFMVYDDGEEGVLFRLADEFGPSILGVVLAHEFGHAIQARAGELDRGLPTIATEQQADCFAGAWVARAAHGEADGIDVHRRRRAHRARRDDRRARPDRHRPVRRRAGTARRSTASARSRSASSRAPPAAPSCSTTRSRSSPTRSDRRPAATATPPFGYGDERDRRRSSSTTSTTSGRRRLATVGADAAGARRSCRSASTDEVECADPAGDARHRAPCTARRRSEVFFDEPLALELYDRFGDFVVGYMLGAAWSEAAQQALGSPLAGEERILVGDCLTGAWVADLIPDEPGTDGARRRSSSPATSTRRSRPRWSSATRRPSDDVVGSGFEKIASFREGVFDGIDACTAAHSATDDDARRRRRSRRSTSAPTASTSSSPGRSATTASRR